MKYRLYLIIIPLLLFGCSGGVEENEPPQAGPDRTWWKEGIIYQIYPRSYKDSDGDGVGDLRGVIDKLDYIESLGVTAVWMNPFFESPMVDNGYDVSDYRAILPEFGTMADFNEMLDGLHERNIKFVLDVVVNHSSNQHEWFKESRSSRDNPYRDYYHWWPAEKGTPPYRYSLFDPEGNAWKYDSLTDAYYLHYFAEEQPDLNWENPEVRQEVYDIMKFWADKGVDGFRLDAFQYVSKDTTFPDWPRGYEKEFIKYVGMGPHLHDYLREMNEEVFSKYDVFSVSEGSGSTFKDAHDLVDADRNELDMAYHFETVDLVNSLDGYKLTDLKTVFSKWDSAFAKKGWISIFLSNHDVSRIVTRFGNDSPAFRRHSAQLLTTFLLSMRGTPYTYYGDELGMTNIDFQTIDQYQDIAAINGYKKALSEGADMDLHMKALNLLSRDNGRTPMQWDDSENAGFTTGDPWLPVNENYVNINVDAENRDPNSVLNHFRKMTSVRNDNLVLVYGDYELLLPDHKNVYAYTRTLDKDKMLVILNFSESGTTVEIPENIEIENIVINNFDELDVVGSNVNLQPYQAVVVRLN